MWYHLIDIQRSDDGEINADVCVPATSPWFDGHFPEEPVLPGVAQLGMVQAVVSRALACDLKVFSVSRIRFKRIVRPDDPLTITAAPSKKEPWTYTFRIMIRHEQVSSGMMRFAEP